MLELLIVLYILTRKESFWDPLKEISFLVHAPWQHHITLPSLLEGVKSQFLLHNGAH